jgi:hypothetical protein
LTYPISDVIRKAQYSGSAGTGPYDFSFEVLDEGDVAVYLNSTLLTLTTDYAVTINLDGTGSVTLVAAATGTDVVTIIGARNIERSTDFVTGGDFLADSINQELDSLTIYVQQLWEQSIRTFKFDPYAEVNGVSLSLPTPVSDYLIGWNATGTALQNKSIATVEPGSITLPLDVAQGGTGSDTPAEARAALGLSIGADVQAYAASLTTLAAGGANARTFLGLAIGTNVQEYDALTQKAGKQTLWIPAGALTARTTNGAAAGTAESTTNKVMFKTLDFDASTAEYAQFSVRMPKSWNRGTVSAYFLWSNASGTGTVVWGAQGVAISDDDVLDVAFGTAQTVTDGVTAAGDLMQSAETSAITIAGTPAAADWVVFQFYRDAASGSDTLAVDARLHGVVVIYTTDAANDA